MSEVKTKKGKGNLLMIIVIVLLFIIGVAGSAFAGYYFASKNGAGAKAASGHAVDAAEQKPEEESHFEVKEMIINLADTDSKRILKVAIVLGYDGKNKKMPKELEHAEPVLRDAISNVLSGKKAADFTQKGREDMKKEILNRINPHMHSGKFSSVYYQDIFVQ